VPNVFGPEFSGTFSLAPPAFPREAPTWRVFPLLPFVLRLTKYALHRNWSRLRRGARLDVSRLVPAGIFNAGCRCVGHSR